MLFKKRGMWSWSELPELLQSSTVQYMLSKKKMSLMKIKAVKIITVQFMFLSPKKVFDDCQNGHAGTCKTLDTRTTRKGRVFCKYLPILLPRLPPPGGCQNMFFVESAYEYKLLLILFQRLTAHAAHPVPAAASASERGWGFLIP